MAADEVPCAAPLAAAAPAESATSKQGLLAVLLGTFGLMTNVYGFAIINLVRPSLEQEFGELTAAQNGTLSSAALLGAILGQLAFGAIADSWGRRKVFLVTASLVCTASLGSALTPKMFFGVHIYTTLAVWRFLVGLGIGGEYPIVAANTMENVDAKSSGRALATVFCGGVLGQVLCPLVAICLTAGAGLDAVQLWRPAFAFGALLAAVGAVMRYLRLRETAAFEKSAQAQATKAQQEQGDAASEAKACVLDKLAALFAMRWSLIGTAGAWFLYDIITWGVGLFTTTIFVARPGLEAANVTLAIQLMSLPGALAAIAIAGYMRMRDLQLLGLGLMLLCFLMLSSVLPAESPGGGGNLMDGDLRQWVCLFVFSLMRSCDYMGPNVTTFSVPAQIFPTRIRGTAHGISAAAGKLGAVVGIFAFPFLNGVEGLQVVMAFMATVCAALMLWTWALTPSYGPVELDTIAGLDESVLSLERQALLAERVLFGDFAVKSKQQQKEETLPFAAATRGAGHRLTT